MTNISDLKFDEHNFNLHTQRGMNLLGKSLQELGAGRSILIDKNNNIIAGNGIVEAAGQVGIENVKIIETDGSEIIAVKRTDMELNSPKGREMALADNATAAADLEWDSDAIGEFFKPEDTEKWGVDLDWDVDKEIEEDEVPEVNESEPAKSELRKVYKLGDHRLMCGDSTDAGSVAILMDGQKADMVFTDPPYNVDATSRSKKNGINKIMNDNMSDNDFAKFIKKSIARIMENTFEYSPIYLWHNHHCQKVFEEAINENDLTIKNQIVWVKDIPSYTDTLYRQQHELCFYCKRNGCEIKKESGKDSTIWEIPSVQSAQSIGDDGKKWFEGGSRSLNLHVTQKPTALAVRAINHNTDRDASVLDLFGGSGSTLIACEQLGRKCYMMELDPHYCDVIRKRYWKLTHDSEDGWEKGTPEV